MSSGSVATFCSSTTLPASSTTHAAVSFTDTSSRTKCAMPSLLPSMPEVSCDLASSVREGAADSRSQIAPQPPRYTIFPPIADIRPSPCTTARQHTIVAIADEGTLPRMTTVDTSGFDVATTATGEDDEETADLQAMHEDAVRYIQSHEWAGPISQTY